MGRGVNAETEKAAPLSDVRKHVAEVDANLPKQHFTSSTVQLSCSHSSNTAAVPRGISPFVAYPDQRTVDDTFYGTWCEGQEGIANEWDRT